MNYKQLVIGLIGGLILWSGLTIPQAKAASQDNLLGIDAQNQQPITITSDMVELDNKQYTAVYRGNVVIRQGEITLYCNEIKTWLNQETKRIERIEAQGAIRLVHLDRVITAEAGTYFDQQQKIVLTGNPVCKEGDNVLSGSRITYFMNEDKIIVEDVKSTLQPKRAPDTETRKP